MKGRSLLERNSMNTAGLDILLIGGWCDAHLLVAVVEDAVVLTHEDVTHDPQGATRWRHINTDEGKQALA